MIYKNGERMRDFLGLSAFFGPFSLVISDVVSLYCINLNERLIEQLR